MGLHGHGSLPALSDFAKKGSAETYTSPWLVVRSLHRLPAGFQDGEPTAEDRIHPGYGGKEAGT